MTIEIVIIVMLLASLFGAWVLSVWRKLEMQEENIRNALHQTLVQLSAEREALEGLTELLKDGIDAGLLHEMFSGECTGWRRSTTAGVDIRTTERIIKSTE